MKSVSDVSYRENSKYVLDKFHFSTSYSPRESDVTERLKNDNKPKQPQRNRQRIRYSTLTPRVNGTAPRKEKKTQKDFLSLLSDKFQSVASLELERPLGII